MADILKRTEDAIDQDRRDQPRETFPDRKRIRKGAAFQDSRAKQYDPADDQENPRNMHVKPAEAAPETDNQGSGILPERFQNNTGQGKWMSEQPGSLLGCISYSAACRNQIGNGSQHKTKQSGQQNQELSPQSFAIRDPQHASGQQQEQEHQTNIDGLDSAEEQRAQNKPDIFR